MADSLKAQKLAAARKRLKEYQKSQTNKSVKKEELQQEETNQNSTNLTTIENNYKSCEYNAKNDNIYTGNYFNNSLFINNDNNHTLNDYFDSKSLNSQNENDNQNSVQEQEEKKEEETASENESNTNLMPEIFESESALKNNLFSNTESLRQLSTQLNNLIDDDVVQTSFETDLQKRNQDLSNLLKNEKLKNDQLNLQVREYNLRISQLESEIEEMKSKFEIRLNREVDSLKQQLQIHNETVGILVGEKSELSLTLSQCQTTLKQKTAECEELQGRLKASRHRVSDLEKDCTSLKSIKEKFAAFEQECNRKLDSLQMDLSLKEEQNTELLEKLNTKTTELTTLQEEIQQKNSQLALNQLKIQQLTNNEDTSQPELEIITQQKINLEQRVAELTQTIKEISDEKNEANQKYQQYIQQLNRQIQNLIENLETKNIENENLSKREQSLINHISELELQIQQKQSTNNDEKQLQQALEAIETLQNEKFQLESELKSTINELKQSFLMKDERITELENLMKMQNEQISQLESQIEMKDSPDYGKLLKTMESDKVAASRAVEQNKKLKEQLDELHEGFIKMSNSKLELTEKLETEQHQTKELFEKVSNCNASIEHLHSVIAMKDKELMEVKKQVLQENQLIDRLRHYEANENSLEFLQNKLRQAENTIQDLLEQNTKLKAEKVTSDLEKAKITENQISEVESSKEITQKSTLDEKTAESDAYIDKEKAMTALEERFTQKMQEYANLMEEKQRLEHLVLQLQSETETIGEYVTLYQCQRALLKEKALEKDEQLKRLSHDRQELKIKLDELTNLLQKLLQYDKNTQNSVEKLQNSHETVQIQQISQKTNNNNDITAGKIISLLSEIQTNNLVQPNENLERFHPCPWCSGQLITV